MADVLSPSPNSTEARLAVFLREVAGRQLCWGAHDCCLWLADWASFWLGVPDVAAELRGRYSDEASAKALLKGVAFPLIVARQARAAGMHRTRTPQIGAVGVIDAGPFGLVGAIRTAKGWAMLQAKGFVCVPDGCRVVGAWEA